MELRYFLSWSLAFLQSMLLSYLQLQPCHLLWNWDTFFLGLWLFYSQCYYLIFSYNLATYYGTEILSFLGLWLFYSQCYYLIFSYNLATYYGTEILSFLGLGLFYSQCFLFQSKIKSLGVWDTYLLCVQSLSDCILAARWLLLNQEFSWLKMGGVYSIWIKWTYTRPSHERRL